MPLDAPLAAAGSDEAERAAVEEDIIRLIVQRDAVGFLLAKHVARSYDRLCNAPLCERVWPCIWRERAAEAQRRIEQGLPS